MTVSPQESGLTLESLLDALQGVTKQASDEGGDKEEKKELPAFMQKKEGGSEDSKDEKKEESKDEKKEDKEDKSESKDEGKEEGQTKEAAAAAGAALAREILEKVASTQVTKVQPMNKQASVAGQALAQALLKQAGAGDMTTTNGVTPGSAPQKTTTDNAALEAEGASYIKPMPTGDGIRNTGTVNQILDALISDALSQGAAGDDQVHETGVASQEGAVEDHATPNQVKMAQLSELLGQGVDFDQAIEMIKQAEEAQASDELEKLAAVQELVARGESFEDAVSLVKQAAEEIQLDMEKAAAMESLLAEGIDFEQAAELIKQASAGDLTTQDGVTPGSAPQKTTADNAAMTAEGDAAIKPMPTGDGIRNTGNVNQIFDAIVADALSQGAAGDDQVHQTGVSGQEGAVEDHAVPNQVKMAKLNELVAGGMDFDQAAELVKQAGALTVIESAGRSLAPIARPVVSPLSKMDKLKAAMGGVKLNRDQASVLTHGGAAALGVMGGYNLGSAGHDKKAGVKDVVGKIGKAIAGNGAIHVTSGGTAMGQRASQVRGAVVDAGKVLRGHASNLVEDAKGAARGGSTLYVSPSGKTMGARSFHAKNLATNPLTLAGAGAAAAGGGAYALSREKKAAFDALIEGGVDFDTAAQLVAQKSKELYGE